MGVLAISLVRLLDVISFIIVIQCVLSWIPSIRMSKIYEALSIITDPIEEPIRQVQYRYVSLPIDFSPLIAILLIQLIQRLIFIIFFRITHTFLQFYLHPFHSNASKLHIPVVLQNHILIYPSTLTNCYGNIWINQIFQHPFFVINIGSCFLCASSDISLVFLKSLIGIIVGIMNTSLSCAIIVS